APRDGSQERLLASENRPRATSEQTEPVVEPFQDLLHGQDANARRRELDGERDAVQAPADLGDVFGVVGREHEVRTHTPRAFDEELYRLASGNVVVGRKRERGHPPRDLTLDAEGLP